MINFGVSFIAIIALIVIGGLFALKMGENPGNEFSDYDALKSSDLISKGWVPSYIPRSAYEIKETHNPDTNIVRMRFRFEPGDIDIVKQHCGAGVKTNDVTKFPCPDGTLQLSDDGNGYFTNDPNDAWQARDL